ncbi:hypothetical protein V5R04_14665 [Jonesiaceae bacterium BS-20]|uniref:Uncharacterized protein n=1 Tax=Jonesiaceae bacterium BS-20 TaxID=3120821 RepID=A0AAU7DUS2_9MICO
MNTFDEPLAQIRRLLAAAVTQVSNLDSDSRDAFTQASRTLDGTSTVYQRDVKKHANRTEKAINEAQNSLASAIRLVDELVHYQGRE